MIKTERDLVAEQLAYFNQIGIKDMGGVRLLDRKETKYVLRQDQLSELLTRIRKDYLLFIAEQSFFQLYSTSYYDTADFKLYLDHHNGHSNRYKIRERSYLESDDRFLEVKFKDNKKMTTKKRLRSDSNRNWKAFLLEHSPYDLAKLEKKLTVAYRRIALVDKQRSERVTIDFNLSLSHADESYYVPGLVILEIKRNRFAKKGPLDDSLNHLRIKPFRISKYCMGVYALYSHVKSNLLKKKIIRIAKLLGGEVFIKHTDLRAA